MTQKLKILGPYTPEHEGPFCTRNGMPVEVKIRDGRGEYQVKGYISDSISLAGWTSSGKNAVSHSEYSDYDLMNAEEVPQPREFWINEYPNGDMEAYHSRNSAYFNQRRNRHRVIHVREVLPGEGK
ncbi:hypothetical protein NBRC3280_3467 [Acetobacter pasteurianus NBRC 3280]|uniref:Uncharacterized protein n=1 Tax=Acetobacter pasteurianus NBRC 3278 TaxID=1226660 RepID=A0A401X9D6_ACEPA|nr:hypothetical protein [Acetobacter pasteurianus]GCD60897.1 hypothetical protein NBRC3277_3472 [Acetobacter pasteurianus NBRC 3277]GCD64490.1 hypothetical protein NBRC3278_3583 [Acetobacter pasteurianus NBRC 3278]GCD70832.1 hypothetical protein NBRC3280_3467 [Acetobacter pasteurianus NBRC 3280]